MLTKLPLVFSSLLFSLSGSDGRAADPRSTAVETRASAEPGARSERGRERHDLCAVLSCTAAQRVEIEGVLGKMREQLKALHGSRGDAGKALAAAMRDGALDRKEVIRALDEGDALREKREGIMADALVAIYGALDDPQRAELAKLVETRGTKGLLHGGHGKRDRAKASPGGKGKPAKDKAAKAKRAGTERKDSKAKRFAKAKSRVKAPIAETKGFKNRS